MESLLLKQQKLCKQAFVPIFVDGNYDVMLQIEACLAAGVKVIEYTQRRSDAPEIIKHIKKTYPEMMILAGSTLDDDRLVKVLKTNYPHLRTLDELADLGVDGFVSRANFSTETIGRFSGTHVLCPCAGTVNEAYNMFAAGAHFIKVVRPDFAILKELDSTPLFGFCPLFVTGGMNLETIPVVVNQGVVLAASGFDVIGADCDELPKQQYAETVAARLEKLIEVTIAAREQRFPGYGAALESANREPRLRFAIR